jgi:hypothetical protein
MKNFDPKFEGRLNLFLLGCEAVYNKNFEQMGFGEFQRESFEAKVGRKYVKVLIVGKGQRGSSVHAFVNMEDGSVLKPAGYNKPAKGSRGNIYNKDAGCGRMTAYGPEYNR